MSRRSATSCSQGKAKAGALRARVAYRNAAMACSGGGEGGWWVGGRQGGGSIPRGLGASFCKQRTPTSRRASHPCPPPNLQCRPPHPPPHPPTHLQVLQACLVRAAGVCGGQLRQEADTHAVVGAAVEGAPPLVRVALQHAGQDAQHLDKQGGAAAVLGDEADKEAHRRVDSDEGEGGGAGGARGQVGGGGGLAAQAVLHRQLDHDAQEALGHVVTLQGRGRRAGEGRQVEVHGARCMVQCWGEQAESDGSC